MLSDFIPKFFSTKKIASLIKGTLKCFERSFQCVCNVLQCLWVPVLSKVSRQGREKFHKIIDFNFLQRLIRNLLDPEKGFVYEWIDKHDDELIEIERPIIEVYRVLALCIENHDFKKLDENNKVILVKFYERMTKLKYNFKQWHIYTISEYFKNVNEIQDKMSEVYYHIVESNSSENGRGKMRQNIAIDNIVSSLDHKNICSIKKTVNYKKQDEKTILHIANIIIKYEEKFYTSIQSYYLDMRAILLRLSVDGCSLSLEKNKIILYCCEVCLKWMNRIIKEQSLPESTVEKRAINEEFKKPFAKLADTLNICLQKEFKIIQMNINSCTPELLLKYLILLRNMHKINPIYSVECEIPIDVTFTEKDSKEMRKISFVTL